MGKSRKVASFIQREGRQSGAWGWLSSRETGAESMGETVQPFRFVCFVGLSARWLPLMLMVWEGTSASLSYLLQLLLIAGSCLSFKIAVFQLTLCSSFGVALYSWSTSVNTSILGEEMACEGWVGCGSPPPSPPGPSHQALNTSNSWCFLKDGAPCSEVNGAGCITTEREKSLGLIYIYLWSTTSDSRRFRKKRCCLGRLNTPR